MTTNNANSNDKQRKRGGITGRGFMPGKSGNPKGRPRTKGLLNALRAKVAETADDGRTIEANLVDALITEALKGNSRLAAIQTVFDRLEGRPKQQVDFNDITKALAGRSNEELEFYAIHGHFPSDDTKDQSSEQQSNPE